MDGLPRHFGDEELRRLLAHAGVRSRDCTVLRVRTVGAALCTGRGFVAFGGVGRHGVTKDDVDGEKKKLERVAFVYPGVRIGCPSPAVPQLITPPARLARVALRLALTAPRPAPQDPLPRPLLCRAVPVADLLLSLEEAAVPLSAKERDPRYALERSDSRADTRAAREGLKPEWFASHNATPDTAEVRGGRAGGSAARRRRRSRLIHCVAPLLECG